MPIKDPNARREYQRAWMAERRAEFFKGKCCKVCGKTDKLELDHVDPKQKVSHNIWSWSDSRRNAELAKCQVLCFDCHKKKTIREMPLTNNRHPYTHGTKTMYEDHKCRCDDCRAWRRAKDQKRRAH